MTQKMLLELPQTNDTWYFAVRKLRVWITPEDEPPIRPYLTAVVNLNTGAILGFRLGEQPSPQEVQEMLLSAMTSPEKELGAFPQRPKRIFFEKREWVKALSAELQQVNVTAKYRPQIQYFNAIVEDVEAHLRGEVPEIPGLLAQKGVSPRLLGSLFAAAADFYRAEPWVQLGNEDLLAITVPPQKEPCFAIVMGQGGVEYGLGLYKTWAAVEHEFMPHDRLEDLLTPGGRHVLFFNPPTETPFDDLDALETYGWELADPQAYPVPLVFTSLEEARRPGRDDLRWYEAALRAIPRFVQEHLAIDESGHKQPAEASITVGTAAGQINVRVKYPGGDLPSKLALPYSGSDLALETSDSQPEPPFDRRVMEGDMARMLGAASDQGVDAKTARAQEVMYDAWEESNPARRLVLARKALKISPDCADAYVLLAEEEADTLAQAIDLYRQGAAAGRRALGEDYFEENAGHFWGLLETRPFMRSLEGLASGLWRMKQEDEALEIYQEMLRLNPGDNQGIRYVLADLLLELNREVELVKLLGQFEGDWSAVWTYSRALLEFRKSGAGSKANGALETALEQNPHVPPYLKGEKRIPNRLPDYIGIGDEKEAVFYAAHHLNYWRRTPGALDWLKEQITSASQTNKKKGRR